MNANNNSDGDIAVVKRWEKERKERKEREKALADVWRVYLAR